MTTYSYSTNEENYFGQFEKPEQAAEEGFINFSDIDGVWVGENIKKTAHDFISAQDILEKIAENAGDECGECVGDWLYALDKNKRAELTKLIGDWIESNDPVKFWIVDNVEEHLRSDYEI